MAPTASGMMPLATSDCVRTSDPQGPMQLQPRTAAAALAEPHVEHGHDGRENHGAENIRAQNECVPETEAGGVAAARHQEGIGDHDHEENSCSQADGGEDVDSLA